MTETKKREEYGADSIAVLEGLEAVRVRPGMYIGSTGVKGLNHLVYEILDNSVDEHLAGKCSLITVTLGKDGSAAVEDDGRGIPVDIHEKGYPAERIIMTTLHAGGKFDSKSYKTSGGLHGVGSSVVNALSKTMTVEVKRDGLIYRDEYAKGIPTVALARGELLPVVGKAKGTGTKITFTPDETIFDTVEFKAEAIRDRLHETAYLNPGLTLVFCNERDGKEKEVFHEAEGLAGYVDFMLSGDPDTVRLSKTVTLHGERDGITVDAAFCYVNDYGETLVSFCNNINTVEGGTHVNGFKQAISKSINQYAHSLHKIKESQNYQAGDIRQGLLAVVSISHPAPRFDGQTKTKLDNNDALNAVSTVVTQRLSYIFDRDTRLIEELLKIVATNASNAPGGGAPNLSDKKFAFEGNGKLARQESSDPDKCELFIVEGKSAGGTAKTGRDRKYQAILPIRGKILNVEKQKIGRVLDNEEIRALVNALGCGFSEGFGNDFDIKKLRYHKIIIAADADVDGGHISTLLLTFFYRFLPELIHAGKLFRAMPPLYRVKPKRGKTEYLYDDKALAEYRKKHGTNFDIQRYKGLGEMDASQLWETTMDPRTRKLKKITMDDVIDANRMTSVLMGEEVPPRRKYIMDNADKANLDV